MEFFRAIQCYACFAWCKHYRNNCPLKDNPICSRCSQSGHIYTECPIENKIICCNCGGSHIATARICPEYSTAVENLLPIIAAQLAHHLVKTSPTENQTPSDNAIGTDILRAAALNSENQDDFLLSLFESCKIFANNNPSQPGYSDYLEDSYGSLSALEPENIMTKDTTIEDALEELNKEILLATKDTHGATASDSFPPNYICQYGSTITKYPTAFTKHIPSYDDCQYGLTNNGVETIELIEDNISQYASFKLKNPKNDDTPTNILYLQISPYQNIIFCNPNNHQKIAMKAEMIDSLILYKNL